MRKKPMRATAQASCQRGKPKNQRQLSAANDTANERLCRKSIASQTLRARQPKETGHWHRDHEPAQHAIVRTGV